MNIDFNKPLRTKSGLKVEILIINLNGPFTIGGIIRGVKDFKGDIYDKCRGWTIEGKYLESGLDHPYDLVNVSVTKFINLCKDKHGNVFLFYVLKHLILKFRLLREAELYNKYRLSETEYICTVEFEYR